MGLAELFHTNYPVDFKMSQQQNILKRKKSFKRRRIMENVTSLRMTIIFLMSYNLHRVLAVPAMGCGYLRLYENVANQRQQQLFSQRNIRDVGASLSASLQQQQHKEILKDSLQQSSSTEVSLEQPQGQCLLDGEYVPETTVFCEKQVGCRAIQKTGHCCPDYKCDCQKDGKTYSNGDKLVDPETPCKVCYCQGGEILCSSVTCFHRDDCTPKYITGVCCPEYDNCPVAISESTTNKTLLITLTTTSKPEIRQEENSPKITIKEITKPTEIRITNDNKAIPIQQMLRPSTTSTTSTTLSTGTYATTTIITTTLPPNVSAYFNSISSTQIAHLDAINAKANTSIDNNQQIMKSSNTISGDKNPSNKNIKNVSKGGAINIGDTLKLSASVAYPSTVLMSAAKLSTLAPLDASAEVEDPVPALSVFSTQGLPEDPSKVNIKREYLITTEGVSSAPVTFDSFGSGEYPNSELIFSQTAQGQNALNAGLQQSSAELDPETAGSDNIYHIILTTDGPRMASTSENYLALKGVSTTEGLPFDELSISSISPLESSNNLDSAKIYRTTEEAPKQEYSSKATTELAMHQHIDDEDSVMQPESNPAYPSLPEDDFSLRDNNFQINDSDDIADEPRSGGHNFDVLKSTKHLDDHTYGSGSGSGSGMLTDEFSVMHSSSTEGSGAMWTHQQSTENYSKLKSSEAIQLMYSAEDSSGETRITNLTDFKAAKDVLQKTTKMYDSSLEASDERQLMEFEIGSGSGSGSGEIKSAKQQKKEREPTTARPNKKSADVDIDEIHDASGNGPEDDPKLDAESLKVEETAYNSPTYSDKLSKNKILSVKGQENNFH